MDFFSDVQSSQVLTPLLYSECVGCLGVGAASMAKLTFMVGGVEEEYNAAQELLTCMGANVVYCGQVGTGQVITYRHTQTTCLLLFKLKLPLFSSKAHQ